MSVLIPSNVVCMRRVCHNAPHTFLSLDCNQVPRNRVWSSLCSSNEYCSLTPLHTDVEVFALALQQLQAAPSAVGFMAYASCPRLKDGSSCNWNISCHTQCNLKVMAVIFWYPGEKHVPEACSENSKAEHEFGCRSEDCVMLVLHSQKNKERSNSASATPN